MAGYRPSGPKSNWIENNVTANQVFSADLMQATLDSLNASLCAISNAMTVVEDSLSSLPSSADLPTPTRNLSLLPSLGSFSNVAYSNVVYVYDTIDLGPDASPIYGGDYNLEITISANEIISIPFTAANTSIFCEHELTVSVNQGQPSPVTVWLSVQPGGLSIAKNSYLGDRAMAISATNNDTILLFESTDEISNTNIYTHAELVPTGEYWLNFTPNVVGHFSNNKMKRNYNVPVGECIGTTITISGNTLVFEVV